MFTFKPGKKFCDFSLSNGLFCRGIVEFDDNKIICTQKGKKLIHSVREFFDESMVMTISCDGHSAKKFYSAVGTSKSLMELNWVHFKENNLI